MLQYAGILFCTLLLPFSAIIEISFCYSSVFLQLSTAEAVQIARRQVDAYRETYDNLVAEDKVRVLDPCSSR